MSSFPGQPANPELLIVDSDALIQLLLTNQMPLLKRLRFEYGVTPVIVEAVETEVLGLTRNRFSDLRKRFEKALNSGVLSILDASFQRQNNPAVTASLLSQANRLGAHFYTHVDRGEAYSHAAAVTFGVPILTHDMKAIGSLRENQIEMSRTKLRVFDLLVFGLQIDALTVSDCEDARSTLLDKEEFVTACFQKCSFSQGAAVFLHAAGGS